MFAKFVLIALLCLFGVNISRAATGADQKFEKLANDYIAKMLKLNPEQATQLGAHQYDNRLGDYSAKGVKASRDFNNEYLVKLNKLDLTKLSRVNNIDARIMRENLEYAVFQADVLRGWENNPMSYNVGSALDYLISREFAPLDERLANLQGRLEQIPMVIAAAKANLKNPPRIATETAIAQNDGVIGLIRDDLQVFVDRSPKMKTKLQPARDSAIAALTAYGKWLKEDLLPRSNGDFRLGDEKFRQKLKFALSSNLSKEDVLSYAEADLKLTQDKMFELAGPLFKKFNLVSPDLRDVKSSRKQVIKAVLNKLAETHPTNETIVSQAEKDLQATTDFVRAKNLVTVPTDAVKVVVMPEYARGSSVAYCDSTGPFEKNNSTFFAISPTPKDWTDSRKQSFFREYNDFMMQDLTIHEAMPGHYLQLMHANKFAAPTKIRAIFQSGSFVEGWAVYAEQMMAENGYGGAETQMQQLKMKLRVIINAIIDQKIHTENMSEKQAIDFMMNEGFQEEGEAAGKWKRAQLSSTQLSTYYIGSVEVNDIRNAFERKNGRQTNLQTMHDQMLAYGSPAAKYVKEMMDLN